MARKYIGSTLSGGVMALCIILLITPAAHSQFTGTVQKLHISGNVGESGVTMEGFPVSPAPVTDENGVYSVEVRYNWSGTVTPTKLGFTFEPKQRTYSGVSTDKVGEDYVAKLQTFVISGTTVEPNVVLRGLPGDPMSDANGRYSVTVQYGFTGTVTPDKEGYRFEPPTNTYTQLIVNKTSENYVARKQTFAISGAIGVEGVTMEGLPGNPKTAADGTYKAEVEWGWSGTITPKKEGHEFMPPYKEYASVMMPYTNEDYTVQVFHFEISGTTGMSGVILEGLPGDPITDLNGMYTASVPWGFTGKVTPTKIGYSFSPPSRDYPKVVANQQNQDYAASVKRYKLAGNAGIPGAKMVGLPGDVTSGPTGGYEVTVEYGWTGNVSPEKEGYTFEPTTLFLGPVDKDLTRQDFKPNAIKYTLAGSVGVEGVLMQGLPGRILSGAGGSYSVEVPYKYKGTIVPIKEGYTFEPPKREYESLTESRPAEDYSAAKKQYTITGTVTTDKGPLADVLIMTDPPGASATTDINGQFQLAVDHGWKGQLTPVREGCTFTPASRPAGPMVQNMPNLSFLGKMKMVSISDKIALQLEEGKPPEPVQGVLITAKPGEYTARTDAAGKYTIQVPWNWSGGLYPTKEGILFNPESIVYTDVVEDIDNTAPRKPSTQDTGPSRPVGPVVPDRTGPVVPPDATKPIVDANDGTKPAAVVSPAETEKQRLERELEELKKRISQIEGLPGAGGLETILPGGTPILGPGPISPPEQIVAGPLVSGQFSGDLFNVLIQISQKSGAQIFTDLTVKPVGISPVSLTSVPVTSALEAVLKGTAYTYRKVPNKENTYQVFRPITIMFPADDLRQALQDLSTLAQVPIVSDETVVGQVYADLQNVPLESALEMMLAGTGYEMARMDTYYIVGDRKVDSTVFPRISETRHVRLNYIQPSVARGHLSPAFSQYVQASLDPNSHLVTVTAPTSMMDRIVGELKDMDVRPRHVLLDARIVTMERGDLLNIGVEWGMPTASLGLFGDSWPRQGDVPGSTLPTDSWPWALQIGLSFDRTFTNQLTAALNLLKENNQADIISSPQVMGQDGKRSRIAITQEEYFMMVAPMSQGLYYSQSQLETITSGTSLAITPRIGDNNDITLELAVEVSDSIPRGRGSDLPVVTRRTAQNAVTVRDGGTVALAGLTENRTRESEKNVPWFSDLPVVGGLFRNNNGDKATRELAIFVTARIVPEFGATAGQFSGSPDGGPRGVPSNDDAFRRELENSLNR